MIFEEKTFEEEKALFEGEEEKTCSFEGEEQN